VACWLEALPATRRRPLQPGGRAADVTGVRIVKLVAVCLIPGVLLGLMGFEGLAKVGVVRHLFAPTIAGDLDPARSGQPGYRVLFVGNSLTYTHDVPGMVERLANARPGPLPFIVVSDTLGGRGLDYWADNGQLRRLIAEVPWNVVVLQERSVTPSLPPSDRARYMDPPLRRLAGEVRAGGAQTVLFMTWAHEHGVFSGDTYEAMQARIAAGYEAEGAAIGAPVAPVGVAWARAHELAPSLDLWGGDDTHESDKGAYLAACVLYATLTGRSPVGDPYTAGIDGPTSRLIQQVAEQTALAGGTAAAP